LLIVGSFQWNVPAVAAQEVPTDYPWSKDAVDAIIKLLKT
jgi:hypothetical protein